VRVNASWAKPIGLEAQWALSVCEGAPIKGKEEREKFISHGSCVLERRRGELGS